VAGARLYRYRSIAYSSKCCCLHGRNRQITGFGDKILDLESDFQKLGSVAMLRSLIRILRGSLVQTDTEMAEKYANQRYAVISHWKVCHRMSALMGQVTLTFDMLTLKLVCESHLRWGTNLHSEFGHARLRVLELFAMYATDKSNTYCPLPCGRSIIIFTTA